MRSRSGTPLSETASLGDRSATPLSDDDSRGHRTGRIGGGGGQSNMSRAGTPLSDGDIDTDDDADARPPRYCTATLYRVS